MDSPTKELLELIRNGPDDLPEFIIHFIHPKGDDLKDLNLTSWPAGSSIWHTTFQEDGKIDIGVICISISILDFNMSDALVSPLRILAENGAVLSWALMLYNLTETAPRFRGLWSNESVYAFMVKGEQPQLALTSEERRSSEWAMSLSKAIKQSEQLFPEIGTMV